MGNIETEFTTPVFPDFEVISVSVFSRRALNPFPRAERFFGLEFIAYFNCFVLVADLSQIIFLENLSGKIEVVNGTFTRGVMHDNSFSVTRRLT